MDSAYSVLQASLEKPAPQKDMCDIYGELVAAKLRKMDEYARQICMHNMDTIMFEMMINPTFVSNQSPVFPMTSNQKITIVPSPESSVQSLSSYQQSSQPSPILLQSPLSRPVTPALSPNIPNYDSSNHVSHLLMNPTLPQCPAFRMTSNQKMETVRSQTSETSFTPSQSALLQPITPDLSPNVPTYDSSEHVSHLSMNPTSVYNQSPASPMTSNQQTVKNLDIEYP